VPRVPRRSSSHRGLASCRGSGAEPGPRRRAAARRLPNNRHGRVFSPVLRRPPERRPAIIPMCTRGRQGQRPEEAIRGKLEFCGPTARLQGLRCLGPSLMDRPRSRRGPVMSRGDAKRSPCWGRGRESALDSEYGDYDPGVGPSASNSTIHRASRFTHRRAALGVSGAVRVPISFYNHNRPFFFSPAPNQRPGPCQAMFCPSFGGVNSAASPGLKHACPGGPAPAGPPCPLVRRPPARPIGEKRQPESPEEIRPAPQLSTKTTST